jgi:FAD/FMN-containing dehydrogenase
MEGSVGSAGQIDSAIATLTNLLGEQGVLTGASITDRYSRDWSGDYACQPAVVLRPSDTDGVAGAVRICRELGLAIIPQGGHTGLVGGGTPDKPDQIVLSLERMNRVRALDPLGMTMVVEAGCVLQTAKDAALAQGCLLPLALGAQGSCQIGGNIATNAGGLNVLRYGMMRNAVLGLEAVLAGGQVFSDLRALRKNNTGLDLKQLFIGTEGTLGIVTAAALRLSPQPRWVETLWLSADSIEGVLELYRRCRAEAGELLSAFELITAPCLDLALEIDPTSPLPDDVASQQAHALIEIASSGGPDLRPWVEELVTALFEEGLATTGLMAHSTAQAASLWRLREIMVEAQQRRGVHLRTDVSVPISAIAAFARRVDEVLTQTLPGLEVLSYGHIGDGNLHVNALPPAHLQGAAFRPWLAPLTERVNEVVDMFGGSISAEHGIGIAKRTALDARLSPVERQLMRAIKDSLDPAGLLSPGRILATP